jgi:hypothetical protein
MEFRTSEVTLMVEVPAFEPSQRRASCSYTAHKPRQLLFLTTQHAQQDAKLMTHTYGVDEHFPETAMAGSIPRVHRWRTSTFFVDFGIYFL